MCIERCKHGFGRGLRRPTIEMWQGGAFLLYFRKVYPAAYVSALRIEPLQIELIELFDGILVHSSLLIPLSQQFPLLLESSPFQGVVEFHLELLHFF